MGVTIHYRGRLRNLKDAPAITEELEDICCSAGWKHQVYLVEDPADKKLPFQGVTFQPHPDCETVWILFIEDGRMIFPLAGEEQEKLKSLTWCFTKTQFAGADLHIALCRLMRYLSGRWFETFEVHDEGGYWETGDEVELKRRMGNINDAISALEEDFSAIPLQQEERVQYRIEKILEALRKKRRK